MANLRADNLCGPDGRNAMKGSVFFSGYVDGTSADWLQIHDNLDDFDIGTGDFTFECWLKAAESSGGYAGIFGMYNYDNTAGILIQISNAGKIRLVNGTAIDQSGSTVLWGPSGAMGSWHHIAVARSGSTIKAFVNGVEEISHSYSSAIDFANGGSVTIGVTDRNDYPGDYDLKGYISNLRLIKGTALYTAAFTPSTEELTAVDGTVLLCCQDTDDPTQEATGRHEIIGFRKCYQGKRYSNIATNGDLEDGTTTGWTNSGCSTFEVSTNVVHSGSYSLHCVSDGNGDAVYYTVSVNTSLRYKISAYINCVGPGNSSAKAKMKIGSSAGDNTNYESQTANNGAGWQYVEWIGYASASTTYITFNESSSNDVNDWYVDDLKVEIWYPEESENILANPNFLTDATGWAFSSTPSGEYTISGDKLNLADNSRTSNAYATQQIFPGSIKEGRYRIHLDYAVTSGAFDFGVGNSNVWSVSGTSSATHELEADGNNSSFRIIGNQHCVATWTNITLYRIAEPKRINPVPPYGIDEGVTFEGETKHNTQSYMYFPTGDTSQRSRGRAVMAGSNPSSVIMSYLSIQSQGNSSDFGDLVTAGDGYRGGSSYTRGLWAHSATSPYTNTIDYVEIATTGNALDFGDMTGTSSSGATGGNDTRAVFWEGTVPSTGVNICYATFASKGNAADFGDMTIGVRHIDSMNSSTRCVIPGGWQTSPDINTNVIQYVTIATTGNAQDFGDVALSNGIRASGAFSSPTRGIYGGGANSPSNSVLDTIEYVTLASTGNATDFGNITTARRVEGGGTSSHTRGLFTGGHTPTQINTIDYVEIVTTGNASDFGDLTSQTTTGALSDCHGGLS